MKEKIIALSLAFTLLTGLSACKKKEMTLVTNTETKEEQLSGNLYIDELQYYYIVESYDKDGYVILSLVYDKYNNKDLYTQCGEVISILPFKFFIKEYGLNKAVYTSDEVEKILEFTKENYNKYKESKKVKKLELIGEKIYGK